MPLKIVSYKRSGNRSNRKAVIVSISVKYPMDETVVDELLHRIERSIIGHAGARNHSFSWDGLLQNAQSLQHGPLSVRQSFEHPPETKLQQLVAMQSLANRNSGLL